MCLHAGCEASFPTSELIEQHIGVHALSDTSRLARNNSAVNIAYNQDAVVAREFDAYTPWFPSAASPSENYVGASSDYSELPPPVGDLPVVNNYSNNSYALSSMVDTTAHGPPAAGLLNNYVASLVAWSDPLDFGKNSILPGGPHDSGKDSVDLRGSALPKFSNKAIIAAQLHYPVPSRYVEDPFGTNAPPTDNDILLTGPSVRTNGHAGAMNLIPVPKSNSALIPLNTEPPTPPTCPECNQTFTRQSDLKRHAKIHQTDSKFFSCQVEGCTYSSYRKDKLGEHMSRRHSSRRMA